MQSEEYFICEHLIIVDNDEKIPFSDEEECSNLFKRYGEKLRNVRFTTQFHSRQESFVTSHCHNLTHVSFEGVERCTPELWTILSNKVTRLDLSGCSISDLMLHQVPQLCPQLIALGLSNTATNDKSLHVLTAPSSHIIHLDISFNGDISDSGVLCVVQNLTKLQSLNIEGNTDLTNLSLSHISTHCAGTLQTLFLNCGEVDDEGVAQCAPAFGEEPINELLERCSHLRTLYLGRFVRNSDISDLSNVIKVSPDAVRNLTTLILGCQFVCEDNLIIVGKYCTGLQVLAIDDGDYIFPHQSLMGLVDGCVNLKEVYINLEIIGEVIRSSVLGFALAFLDLWMKIRPGLVIQHVGYDWEYTKHNVMNI